MTDEPFNLVLELLRAIRTQLASVEADVREIKGTQATMLSTLAALRRDQANDAEISAHLHVRLDRLTDEVNRIKRRLDLVDN